MSNFSGRTLGPYKLETALGKGGMATVYRAFQTTVKRYVAVKVMSPEIADNPGFVERFTREAEVIASLQHPHILPVIDYGEAEGVHFLVMRYIENGSLEDRMRKAPLTLDESARFLDQIASALDYAHKRGVVHRDFKPNNVLLDAEENCYLTDFGIARLTMESDSHLTATGTVMGTPAYMSPEQGTGRPVDGRSDIYSLGVVLYEMVLQRLPFSADTPAALIFQHVYESPTPPKQIKPDLPDAIASVLMRTLAKNPDDRYQSAAEVTRAFSEALGRHPATPPKGTDALNTMVGGPIQNVPSTSASNRQPTPPPMQALDGRTIPPGTPMPITNAKAPQPIPPMRPLTKDAPIPAPTSGTAPPIVAPPTRRGGIPVALIAVAALLLLIIVGGGAFAVINSNNQNATNEAGTRVAVLALSATATASNTSTPTATLTVTPSPTTPPSATSTFTPNATGTALIVQMSTINAYSTLSAASTATQAAYSNASATMAPQLTATQVAASNASATMSILLTAAQAAARTQTAAANLTATVNTNITTNITASAAAVANTQIIATQTQLAVVQNVTQASVLTATAKAITANGTAAAAATINAVRATQTQQAAQKVTQAANLTATARAALNNPTDTPVPQPTDTTSPEQVMQGLQRDGILTSIVGNLAVQRDEVDVNGDKPNYFRWKMLDTGDIADFVMAADVTWSNPQQNDECGFLLRYSGQDTTQQFYGAVIGIGGHYRIITYQNDKDSTTIDKPASAINTSENATNHLLMIGQGNAFRMFVNGKQIASFALNKFDKGTFAAMAATGDNAGLSCQFKNLWLWELGGSDAMVAGLTSNDPTTIINTLVQAGEVTPGSATIALRDNRRDLTETQGNAFSSTVLSSRVFQNFVFSTDITWDTTFEDSACGFYYNATNPSDNWVAIYFLRDQTYSVYVRKAAKWGTDAVATGKTSLLKTSAGDTNRLTLTSINGTLNVYLNGQFAFTAEDSTLPQGGLGYYMQKHDKDGTKVERCRYANTIVWALK